MTGQRQEEDALRWSIDFELFWFFAVLVLFVELTAWLPYGMDRLFG